MQIVQNKIYNNSDDKLLIMQATIDANRQYYGEKTKKLTEYLTAMFASMMDKIKFSKYSLGKNDSPKSQYTTTVVPAN